MANITNYLNKIKTAVYGKDVRGAIHDAIKQVYDDASVNHDNANMEVKMARGTHNTLNDRLDKSDEIQAQTNAQLSTMFTVNVANYSEYCVERNGVMDWSNAFKRAWDDLQDCGTLIIPSGEYFLTRASWNNKNGVIIQNYGVLKHVPNATPMFGMIYISNVIGSVFYNLNFDGTANDLIDSGVAGATCLLALENVKDVKFENLTAIDAQWCAVCSNGNCDNISFNNLRASNIGEHVIYLSGENNTNFSINNGTIENIGINPNCPHSGGVFKNRLAVEGGKIHRNIILNNVTLRTTKASNHIPIMVWAYDVDEVRADNIEIIGDRNACFAVLSKNLQYIKLSNSRIYGHSIYNATPDATQEFKIIIENTTIDGYEPCFNLVTEYRNCNFIFRSNFVDKHMDTLIKPKTVKFINCNFMTNENKIWFRVFKQDLAFIDCVFDKDSVEYTNPDALIRIGETSSDEDKTVSVIDCTMLSNYAVFMGIFNKIKLKIINSYLYNGTRCYNGTVLKKYEAVNLTTPSWSFAKLDAYNDSESYIIGDIVSNRGNHSRRMKTYSINTGNASANIDLRYDIARTVGLTDLLITLSEPLGYTITSTNDNIFALKLNASAPKKVDVTVMWNITN